MIPVFQTRKSSIDGNCFAACVASLTGLPLEEIDIDTPEAEGWFQLWTNFLKTRGFSLLFLPHPLPDMDVADGTYAIAIGKSTSGVQHAVVAKASRDSERKVISFEVEFDPMGHECLLEDSVSSIVFVLAEENPQ